MIWGPVEHALRPLTTPALSSHPLHATGVVSHESGSVTGKAEDAGELAKRCEEAADRVAKRCMGHDDAPALISIPRQPTDIDAVLTEAAAALRRMAALLEVEEAVNLSKTSALLGWKDRATAAEAALTHFQDEVWGAFQTWSMALGWGITGMQPECYAMMDASIDRMLSAEAEAERLKARVAEMEKALSEAVDVLAGMNDDEINEDLLPRLRAALAQEGKP